MTRFKLTILNTLLLTGPALAEDKEERIEFERGKSEAIVSGKVVGRDLVLYKLNAREGQFLQVKMLPDAKGADFNIFIPGKVQGMRPCTTLLLVDRVTSGNSSKPGIIQF